MRVLLRIIGKKQKINIYKQNKIDFFFSLDEDVKLPCISVKLKLQSPFAYCSPQSGIEITRSKQYARIFSETPYV